MRAAKVCAGRAVMLLREDGFICVFDWPLKGSAMPGLFDLVRRVEELGGEIKAADDVVKEDTIQRDRAKRIYDQTEKKLIASVAMAVKLRGERDEKAGKLHTEALKTGEPLDPADHTPMVIEGDNEDGN